MGDTEFEEFQKSIYSLPGIKPKNTPSPFYSWVLFFLRSIFRNANFITRKLWIELRKLSYLSIFVSLIPDIDDLDDSPSKSDTSDQEDGDNYGTDETSKTKTSFQQVEDDDGLKICSIIPQIDSNDSSYGDQTQPRRRRKLPEIPKNKKCKCFFFLYKGTSKTLQDWTFILFWGIGKTQLELQKDCKENDL